MQQQYGIVAMIQQGYYATYPLIAISVLCIAVILERLWALGGLRARTARTAAALVEPLRKGEFDEALKKTQARKRPFERIFYAVITAARTQDRDKLVQLDEESRFEELLELKRYIWVLATLRVRPVHLTLRHRGGNPDRVPVDGDHGDRRFFRGGGGHFRGVDFNRAGTGGRDHRGHLLQLFLGPHRQPQRGDARQRQSSD